MAKLGSAYLEVEVLQFGMGIEPPRFSFWEESTSTPQPLALFRVLPEPPVYVYAQHLTEWDV